MKTKEELNALKEEVEPLNKKLADLNEDELAQVAGGLDADYDIVWNKTGDEVENPLEPGDYTATITSL